MLSYGSENVRDALVEAMFLSLCSRSQSLMMFCWRHWFYGYVLGSVTVDGVLLDAMFLWRCWESQSVDDVLLEEVL